MRVGTGKTYASAFAMGEIGIKRVLFIVHRRQLAMRNILRKYVIFFVCTHNGIALPMDYLEEIAQNNEADQYLK